jgi:hypothetical protein
MVNGVISTRTVDLVTVCAGSEVKGEGGLMLMSS